MVITATEFKTNFGKYLDLLRTTDDTITITRNGKKVATIAPPKQSAVEQLSLLIPAAPRRVDYDALKAAALGEKYEINL